VNPLNAKLTSGDKKELGRSLLIKHHNRNNADMSASFTEKTKGFSSVKQKKGYPLSNKKL
jgi:hypothetical protein